MPSLIRKTIPKNQIREIIYLTGADTGGRGRIQLDGSLFLALLFVVLGRGAARRFWQCRYVRNGGTEAPCSSKSSGPRCGLPSDDDDLGGIILILSLLLSELNAKCPKHIKGIHAGNTHRTA